MQFNYTAVNKKGDRIQGVLDAPSESEVRVMLRSQQLRPLKILKAGALEFDLAKLLGSGVKLADILLFTRQLSILISSGIPLVQAMDIISSQLENQNMKSIVLTIKEKITGGTFLWESMATFKNEFPPLYISMVRAGESSGNLDTIFKRLIKYLEDIERLKKLVIGALIYPAVIVAVGITVVIVLMTFVIPRFEQLLKGNNQELPGPTQFVINVSHFFQHNILFIIIGIGVATYFILAYRKTEEGKRFFDYYSLKIPLFGTLIKKIAIARFARTMQTLLSSGITLLDALDICKSAAGNKTIEENVGKMRIEVEQGKTLSSVMSKTPIFPSMVVQMVSVGESTGNLDKMLERVAEFYEEEVQVVVASLTRMIEPLVLIVLGGLVGGLMIAMYLPIFKVAGGG